MELHVASLANPVLDAAAIAEMEQLFHSYTAVPWAETRKGSFAFANELLFNCFSSLPYSVQKYRLHALRTTAEELSTRHRFDLVCCDFLPPAVAMLESSLRPRVIFEHNVEFILRKRMWAAEDHPLKKWVFAAEWKKTWSIEKRVCRGFDHVLTVSDEDSKMISQQFGIDHVSSIPTGVDTDFFTPQGIPPSRGHLVFVGSLDWYPNEEGVLWFLNEVFPRIHASRPEARFTIVGKNPSNRLRHEISGENKLELTGRVDDVRPYLARAEVVVVPLRVGGGTRIKIPEAMAMQKPIVSTSLGAEGLSLIPGREILVEDEAEAFAEAVLSLLNDQDQAAELAKAARDKVVREHSWDKVADVVQCIFECTVKSDTKPKGTQSLRA